MRPKIKLGSSYFVYKSDKDSPIKFKKKDMLALLDNEHKKEVSRFADVNRLSFKKENDLKKIFAYNNR